MMVNLDLEAPLHEIWASGPHFMKDGHHLFLVGLFSQIVITQLLTGECQGAPFLHQEYSKTSTHGIKFQDKSVSIIWNC
jgi:hypothetical protein